MHKIIKIGTNEFQFIYEDVPVHDIPIINKGDTFIHEDKKYRVDYHSQGFQEEIYTSFLVIAEPVKD